MNNLQIFKNKEFGEVRTVVIDNEPWMVGVDVAKALGYSDASSTLARKVDKEDKKKETIEAHCQNGNVVKTQTILINESGLYSLVLNSKLESAKKFKRWITTEVLPSIRKTGAYQPKSMSAIELISLTQQACLEVNEKVDAVKTDLEDFKLDLPLLGCDMDRITTIVKKIGTECLGGKESNAYKDNVIRARVYADIYDQLKRQFGVTSYKNIRRCECNMAVGIVNEYQLPIVLKNVIDNANNQMSLV